MNKHWLVIGGGPSARESFAKVKDPATIITTNAGGNIVRPDVYWLSDPVAIAKYRDYWLGFLGEVICNDEAVKNARGDKPTTLFPYLDKGPLFHGRCSGVLCCRVAISRGAKRLSLIGFDGYNPEDWLTGIDGKPVQQRGEQALKVNEAQALAFADMAKSHPDVAVTVYGPTRIRMPKTWRVV